VTYGLSIDTKIDTLDDLELYKCEFSVNFWISQISEATTVKRMKIGPYCLRQCCKHVELEHFSACFRVAWVCQRQLSFLVFIR